MALPDSRAQAFALSTSAAAPTQLPARREPVAERRGFDDAVVELGSRAGYEHLHRLGRVFQPLPGGTRAGPEVIGGRADKPPTGWRFLGHE
ncbi:hypothetical protein [Amycolatopsis sp. NPDC004378]